MSRIPHDAYVIIIGAMKAGTSFLYSLLAQHPAICTCSLKEPEYFSEQIHGLPPAEKLHRGYETLWNFDPLVHHFALEASTGYSKFPREREVAARMIRYGIKPRIIYIVRDPVERVLSHYRFVRVTGKMSPALPPTDHAYVDFSRYHMQLDQYRPHFSVDELMIVDFDELIHRTQSTVDRITERLSLPHLVIDRALAEKHETPLIKLPELSDLESVKSQLREKLADDIHCFARDYNFPVQKWGF